MAKNPPLTAEQKKTISQYKNSSKKPTEISKETGIPIKQIGGYLHFLRRPSIFNLGPNAQQIQAKPEQIKENKPGPSRPKNLQTGPKKEGVKTVTIEQVDLDKIQEMINTTTKTMHQEVVNVTKNAAQDAATHALTNFKETEKREKEKKDAEAKRAQEQVQVNSFCKQFPDLCSRVDVLEKKAKEPKPELEKEIHSTAKEYLDCPECSSALISAMGKMTKSSPDFAKRIQESLKTQGITLEVHKEAKPEDGKKPPEEENKPEEQSSGSGPF